MVLADLTWFLAARAQAWEERQLHDFNHRCNSDCDVMVLLVVLQIVFVCFLSK